MIALRIAMADPWRAVKYRSTASSDMVTDDYELAGVPESIDLTLMAASDVDVAKPGELRLKGPKRPLVVKYDSNAWQVETERIPIDDARMTPVWGDFITRILLNATSPARGGTFTIAARAGTEP